MDAITQAHALAETPLAGRESARFFAAPRFEGLDCLTATFRTHRYAPHMHDTFAIGCIVEGCETFRVRGARCYAGPGDVAAVNPQEAHDGEPHGAGYSYRMAYPSAALMRRIAGEVADRADVGVPWFPQTVIRDPEGFALFAAAHRALERGEDGLGGEEMLYRAFSHCIARHARIAPAATGAERAAVGRVKALLCERYAEDLGLAELAAEARLSPFQLIRAFRRETAMTPHAFLVDRRIQVARDRLRRNEPVAAVALATGFADQAHLTRVFKARVGVTPGAYRAAFKA
jgi:AraC-like DNA-binding protein